MREKSRNTFKILAAATGFSLVNLATPNLTHAESLYMPSDPNPITLKVPLFFADCLIVTDQRWTGKGSRYSEAGCVGCSPNMLMANTERFDENADTLAFWRVPLNSYVKVTNLDERISRKAKVTDHGGFDIGAHFGNLRNRLFDLSVGLAARLGHFETDKTEVEITLLDC